jgi:V/A-type H+-transporting ATPase subunit I
VIIRMTRARVLGPRDRLDEALDAVQDLGVMHLTGATAEGRLRRVMPADRDERHARQLRDILKDLDAVRPKLGETPRVTASPLPAAPPAFARWARTARRLRVGLERLETRRRALEEERVELTRLTQFVAAFHGLLPRGSAGQMHSYYLVLRGEDAGAVARLREALGDILGDRFMLATTPLPSGELAAALLVPHAEQTRVERLLAEAGVHELPIPPAYAGRALIELIPELADRRGAVDAALTDLARQEAALLAGDRADLGLARAVVEDRLMELSARGQAGETPRGFVVEGWVPEAAVPRFERELLERLGPEVVCERVGREEWRGEDAPVVLTNPRLFRPFEAITRMLPLPRYGTIDPTPYVAVFFPMFFGLILGDVGHGLVLGLLAGLLHWRSRPGTTLRAVAEIGGACAVFSGLFGFAFGEFFGDLGRRWFGLRPLVLDREDALLPFLGLTVALGLVHVTLGFVLGIVNAVRGHPRHAVGKTAALLMLLVIVSAILAAVGVLPAGLRTPAVIAILVLFPILIVAEGVIAPIELLSSFSNILSYARIMALGTASVMMAMVANRLAGTVGGVVVGILFGLLFHLVNFMMGVFASTIHGLRLHYVEFFGKFYSPGGQQYQPFTHWRPDRPAAA